MSKSKNVIPGVCKYSLLDDVLLKSFQGIDESVRSFIGAAFRFCYKHGKSNPKKRFHVMLGPVMVNWFVERLGGVRPLSTTECVNVRVNKS